MNKYIRFGLTAMTLMFIFSAIAVTETKAQNLLSEILKRLDDNNKTLSSLQANIKMDKYNSQLDEHDYNSGTTKYVPLKNRDALVRIDWTSPVLESLAVVDKTYVLYRQRLNQVITGNVNDRKAGDKGSNNALAFMNMSKAQLKANYEVKYIGLEKVGGTVDAWHLELTPRAAQNYKAAEIWVDVDGMPVQAKVIEKNNDTTTVFLTNIKKNVTINTKIFKIDYPKNAKIIT